MAGLFIILIKGGIMKKGKFKIKVLIRDDIEIQEKTGLISQYFAINDKENDVYVITHLITGMRVLTFEKQKDARKFINIAEKIEGIERLSIETISDFKEQLFEIEKKIRNNS
jgi:hypothetical protein